jgi:hypothetical protein
VENAGKFHQAWQPGQAQRAENFEIQNPNFRKISNSNSAAGGQTSPDQGFHDAFACSHSGVHRLQAGFRDGRRA